MSIDLPALIEGLVKYWYILPSVFVLLYAFYGPLPVSRRWWWWCPNMASLWATFVCLFSYFVLFVGMNMPGEAILFYTWGASFDIIDGRLAREHDIIVGSTTKHFTSPLAIFFHGGTSWFGAIWDSSNDKVRVIIIYAYICYIAFHQNLILIGSLFATIALIDLLSGIRKIYKTWKKEVIKPIGRWRLVGQIKTWVQQIALIFFILLPLLGEAICIVILVSALGLTLGSIATVVIAERYTKYRYRIKVQYPA